MPYIDIDEKENHRRKFVARQAANKRTDEHKHLYNELEQAFGDSFLETVRQAYIRSRAWLNYGPNYMDVKVEKPQHADKISDAVQKLNVFCHQNGIMIDVTEQGAIKFYFSHRG